MLTISKNKVRKLMKNKGINTQKELANELNVSDSLISKMLSDDYDFVKSRFRELCNLLDVEVNEVLEKKIDKEKKEEKKLKLFEDNNDEYVDINKVVSNREYTDVELFAGAGGLALGLEKSGFKTLALIENDQYAAETLINNRPDWNVINKDVEEVMEKGIRNYLKKEHKGKKIDLLSGGYPCQAFSYAGKKLGLKDTRGTLFYYFAEALQELKPKLFLAENVRGLKSHDGGRTLKTMIKVFEEEGYSVEYKVLNSWDFDVAQKRKRLFIVGIRNDLKEKYDLEYNFPKPLDTKLTLKDVIKDVPESEGTTYSENKKEVLAQVPPGGCWRNLPEDVAKEYMGKSYYSSGGRTGMARRLSWDEPSLTILTSPGQKQTERCHPEEVRPFTVRESARIQSFDDEWEFKGTTTSKYKQIGNAVPVNLAKAVGLSLVEVLNEIDEKSRD
ncbi:MAG: DNA (cytosine-5-)-methyltransferase [Bacillota bacterium]